MAQTDKILIVDDEPDVLRALVLMFEDEYAVTAAASGEDAIAVVRETTGLDCVVLDIRMAKMDGLQAATAIAGIVADLPIIFHTGYPGDYSESGIDREHRPFDYIVKGERPERLRRAVRNAVNYHRLQTDSRRLTRLAREHYRIVGKSRAMLDVYCTIEKVAPTNSKVMILGPTGTGKELVARAIHARSTRAGKRLAILSCNHKQPDLVESELFGHRRGAFTGAVADRIGLFEYADGGTVLLDEIGDLDITTQAKLLRVLETGEMQRIGSPDTITVDVRLICATHRNLDDMVRSGAFREDLYFRLKEIAITLPPLSERREDIPDLIDYFVEIACADQRDGVKVFASEARALLIGYDWPGNVRDLARAISALITLTNSCFISADDVATYLRCACGESDGEGGLRAEEREFRRTKIVQVLDRHHGNAAAAARDLRLDAANLRRMMRDLGIDPSQSDPLSDGAKTSD